MLKYVLVLGLVLCPVGNGWFHARMDAAPNTHTNTQGQFQMQGQAQGQGQLAIGRGGAGGSANSHSSSGSLSSADNGGIYNDSSSLNIYPAIPQAPDHSKEIMPFNLDEEVYWQQLLGAGKGHQPLFVNGGNIGN